MRFDMRLVAPAPLLVEARHRAVARLGLALWDLAARKGSLACAPNELPVVQVAVAIVVPGVEQGGLTSSRRGTFEDTATRL